MVLPVLSLAATLWAVVAPEPAAAPVATSLASTYDEAACATLHADDDAWSRAAIGELVPPDLDKPDCQSLTTIPAPRAPLVALDCEDLLPWAGQWMFGTCAVPKNTGLPGLHAAPRGQRHTHLLELALTNSDAAPLAPPRVTPDVAPLHFAKLPQLATISVHAFASHWQSPDLRSHVGEVPLRPPRA